MNPTRDARAHLTLLALVVGIALVMVSGLGLAIHFALTPTATSVATDASYAMPGQVSKRDGIAAAEMMKTDPEAARGGTPALGMMPTVTIPRATENGPEGVPAGYPHTPEGAAGQLSDILWSVLGAMDLAHAQRVQATWFEDPTPDDVWPVMLLIQEFLRAGQLTSGLEPGASMRVEPAAAQIKGSDGDDWHVACVLVEITYTYRDQPRMAYGHCERMAWTGQRWVIGSGSHPVPAPSTWPGTELALEAGWRVWVEG